MKYIRYSGYLSENQNEKLNKISEAARISKAKILGFLLDLCDRELLPKSGADQVTVDDFNQLLSSLNEFKSHVNSELSDLHTELLISQNQINELKGDLIRSESLSDCSGHTNVPNTVTTPQEILAVNTGESFSNKELTSLLESFGITLSRDALAIARKGDYSKLPMWFSSTFESRGSGVSARWFRI